MSNPTTFDPLVTDFTVEWDEEPPPGALQEGERHEHGLVTFENGYIVSFLRTNASATGDPSFGFENGNWEAVVCRPATGFYKMLGMVRQPATEMDHLHNMEVDGAKLSGDLDNAALNKLFADVQAAPAYVAPEETGDDPFSALFDMLSEEQGE